MLLGIALLRLQGEQLVVLGLELRLQLMQITLERQQLRGERRPFAGGVCAFGGKCHGGGGGLCRGCRTAAGG